MATKAALTVVLMADKTVVAESEDPILWQQILAAINKPADDQRKDEIPDLSDNATVDIPAQRSGKHEDAVARFAQSIGVTHAEVTGALAPSSVAPYLHLDAHCWAAMKKALGQRGNHSISPIGLAATVLGLWFKGAAIDAVVTQNLALGVLNTINLTDKNPSRGIKNTRWLQSRPGGVIVVNPAEIARAHEVAASFCTKNWVKDRKA